MVVCSVAAQHIVRATTKIKEFAKSKNLMQAIQEMETVEKQGDISDAAAMVRLTTQIHCMHGETENSTSELQ